MSTWDSDRRSMWRGPSGLALAVFLAAAGFFLWAEHQAHLLGALPYLLLLACLVMHLFMHGGHGGHDRHHEHTRSRTGDHDEQ